MKECRTMKSRLLNVQKPSMGPSILIKPSTTSAIGVCAREVSRSMCIISVSKSIHTLSQCHALPIVRPWFRILPTNLDTARKLLVQLDPFSFPTLLFFPFYRCIYPHRREKKYYQWNWGLACSRHTCCRGAHMHLGAAGKDPIQTP